MARYSQYHPATPYLFFGPFLAVFAVFMVYPLLLSMVLAVQQTFGAGFTRWVGLYNFTELLRDPQFWIALRNTVYFAAGSLLLQLPIALGLAMLLNRPDMKGRAIYRLILFSPALVGAVFVGVMFGIIFQEHTGLLNRALHVLIGWDPGFPWLREYVMPALILAALWMWTGYNMIYFLAALQNIDPELVEASKVDGANPWQRFRHVTLPAIMPVASFVVLLSMIGSFQLFELPFLLLGGAGPDYQGLTVVMYLYQTGFQTGDLGYASAIGWCLAFILVGLALFQRWVNRKEAY